MSESALPPPVLLPIAWAANDLANSLQTLTDTARAIRDWVEANQEPIGRMIDWAGRSWTRAAIMEQTGWLPHYTQPDDLFPVGMDGAAGHVRLDRHYRENWPIIEAHFRERLATYEFDGEAKACFSEALTAHGLGLYRTPPRLLFPEIERLTRKHLADLIDNPSAITSLREPRAKAEDLGFSNLFRSGVFSLRIYKKFASHLYAPVLTPDALEAARADPVPNRHAALHGLVVYSSMQSSLNALIMAEFAMLTVDALRSPAVFVVGGLNVNETARGATFSESGASAAS